LGNNGGIDYSAVSQVRKPLQQKPKADKRRGRRFLGRSRMHSIVKSHMSRLIPPYFTPTFIQGDTSEFREATGWKPEIPFGETLGDLLNY